MKYKRALCREPGNWLQFIVRSNSPYTGGDTEADSGWSKDGIPESLGIRI